MNRDGTEPEFWKKKPLDALTRHEWEALCDGCGRCCLLKLEDEDTAEVHYTDIHCRLFDPDTCRCGNYALRRQLVPGCVVITPENIEEVKEWMPGTCAYRLLAEGRPLFDWHPLVSGDADSVHKAGISMRSKTTPEFEVDEDDFEDHAIEGIL
jgi:uncharacterized cysteine cluster protein YcgN (CxxCxxCC family)